MSKVPQIPFIKEVPLFTILARNTSSNFSTSVLVNMWLRFLKKPACYRPFRNGHFGRVCTKKMIDQQYRKNSARNIYSNHNQMRTWILPKSVQKNYTLSTFPSRNQRNLEDSRKVLAVSVSEFYQSIAVKLSQLTLIKQLKHRKACIVQL